MITITAADLKKFAPRAHPDYVAALLGSLDLLRSTGILETELRLCHFMGQVGAETGGLTIIRENLMYMTAKRLREVWPARFRAKTDEELAPLIKNPVRLGDAVYGGRMGNNIGGDGYAFRGGGFLQTTGRAAVTRYCKACNVPFTADVLDDVYLTLRFACHEWAEAGCNELADENDLTKVSKAINTGSATSNTKPVGMQARQEWFGKAWAIWGSKGKPDTPAKPAMTVAATVTKIAAPVAVGTEAARQVVTAAPSLPSVPQAVKDGLGNAEAWQGVATQGKAVVAFWGANPAWLAAAAAIAALIYFAPKLFGRG